MALFPIHRGPMTPEDIARERRRLAQRNPMTQMPTDVAQGLTAVGQAIAERRERQQFEQQYGPLPQQERPIVKIAEAVSGNRMPWQFPDAPNPPQGQPQQPQSNMPQPHPSVPQGAPPGGPAQQSAIANALSPKPGARVFDAFASLFKPKVGGLW